MKLDVSNLISSLKSLTDSKQALILSRFFKTGPGQYGEGDVFWGIKVPVQRRLASKYFNLSLSDLCCLLKSGVHEQRLIGLLILLNKYEMTASVTEKSRIVIFYLQNLKAVNNWDLVDISAPNLFGHFLYNYFSASESRVALLQLAASPNLWARRLAVVSTLYFIRQGSSAEIFMLTKKLSHDKHDLIHKAMGWMLREVGKKIDRSLLLKFLDDNGYILPRTTLRYAIEHLDTEQRLKYLRINSK